MVIFLSLSLFIASAVMLAVYAIRLRREKKRYLGKENLAKIAEKTVKEAKKHDRFITCDYCGAKVDTSVHLVCPQCGGAFGHDEEWEERHEIDVKEAGNKAEKEYLKEKGKLEEKIASPKRRIKAVAILSLLIFCTAAFATWSSVLVKQELALSSDTLPAGYSEEPYSFKNSLLVEEDGMSVRLGKIFMKDFGKESRSYAVEIVATNTTGKTVRLSVRVGAINDRVNNLMLYESPIAGDGRETVRYLIFNNTDYPELSSMAFIDLIVENENGMPILGIAQPFIAPTDAAYEPAETEMKGETIFRDEQAVITLDRTRRDDGVLYIKNIGRKSFSIDASGIIDERSVYIYLHDTVLPGMTGTYALSDIFPTNGLLCAGSAQLRIIGRDLYMTEMFDTGYMTVISD